MNSPRDDAAPGRHQGPDVELNTIEASLDSTYDSLCSHAAQMVNAGAGLAEVDRKIRLHVGAISWADCLKMIGPQVAAFLDGDR